MVPGSNQHLKANQPQFNPMMMITSLTLLQEANPEIKLLQELDLFECKITQLKFITPKIYLEEEGGYKQTAIVYGVNLPIMVVQLPSQKIKYFTK